MQKAKPIKPTMPAKPPLRHDGIPGHHERAKHALLEVCAYYNTPLRTMWNMRHKNSTLGDARAMFAYIARDQLGLSEQDLRDMMNCQRSTAIEAAHRGALAVRSRTDFRAAYGAIVDAMNTPEPADLIGMGTG
ncbi:MAG: hypothetical protein MJH10_20015 [Epibacterium sp.]|nr:hypothetical protein [Epibacterium sp.]NQX75766.1 hypothetical protein [Epibacterium sp.]